MNNFCKRINNQENESKDEIIINNLKCPICNKICLIEINKEKLSITLKCNNNCNYSNKFQNNIICGKSIQKENSYLNKNEKYCIYHYNKNLNSYSYYCFDCKKNLCQKCQKEHEHHKKIELKIIKPKHNEIFINKIKIKEKFDKITNIIKDVKKWKKEFEDRINSYINEISNIYNIEKFILMNYDNKNSNNYNYIQNYNYIKKLDFNTPELENFVEITDWKEKGKKLMDIIIKNNARNSPNRYKNYSRRVQNLIDLGKTIKNNKEKLTIELNENIEKNKIYINLERQHIKLIKSDDCSNENKNKIIKDMLKSMNIKNVDNNTYQSNETNQNQNLNDNIDIINNENLITRNDVLLNNGRIENVTNNNTSNNSINILNIENKNEVNYDYLELKFGLTKNKVIKSIEFFNDNKMLICTSNSLNIYKINSNFSFKMIYSKDFDNDIINYGTQLSNGNFIICFSKIIKIIIINEEEQLNDNCLILQELKPNNNNFNYNKIIEIDKKNYVLLLTKIIVLSFKNKI